jgi:hypothetical protein
MSNKHFKLFFEKIFYFVNHSIDCIEAGENAYNFGFTKK